MGTLEDYEYNLVLMHYPGFQHIGDFLTIQNMMVGLAPNIRVIIASFFQGDLRLYDNAQEDINKLPTLIFSPTPLSLPQNFRGTRLVTKPASKKEEYALLKDKGFPIPHSTHISKLSDLESVDYGERFVIKPNKGKQGVDVILVERATCKDVVRTKFGESDLDLIAQQWINTGQTPTGYRVFTVLGEVIYCCRLQSPASDVEGNLKASNFAPIAANSLTNRVMECVKDTEIINLGERIHRSFPTMPVLGQDIVRDVDTNELYVVELNSGGWTWHLSSNFGNSYRSEFKLDYYGQFNGLEKITKSLARFTVDHAS